MIWLPRLGVHCGALGFAVAVLGQQAGEQEDLGEMPFAPVGSSRDCTAFPRVLIVLCIAEAVSELFTSPIWMGLFGISNFSGTNNPRKP